MRGVRLSNELRDAVDNGNALVSDVIPDRIDAALTVVTACLVTITVAIVATCLVIAARNAK